MSVAAVALAVLAASLVGSPHCAGMCGGFVCFYAGSLPGRGRAHALLPHLAYNAGRLAAYLALGVVAGTVGSALDVAGAFAGVARAAAIVSGTLMVGWGAARLAQLRGVRIGVPADSRVIAPLQRAFASRLRALRDRPPAVRAAATGLLTSLLPCGWLYAFVVTAAGTGSAGGGALVMLAFWAGTLPMMLALGAGVQRAAGPFARRLPAASAVVLVLVGLLSIAGKLRPGVSLPHESHSPPAVPAHVQR